MHKIRKQWSRRNNEFKIYFSGKSSWSVLHLKWNHLVLKPINNSCCNKRMRRRIPSLRSISSLEPPSIATGCTRPPSHLPTSLYQFRTRLEGDTTMALSISGLKSGLCLSKVHMRVMHCRVFPSPISSAIIQPYEFSIRLPVTQSHRNFTPYGRKL